MGAAFDSSDPLAIVLAPPPNETPAERWAREQIEAEARRISEQIDDQLKAEKQALKKRKKPIKVLLLGQSESGKSTTVKNFQLAYAYSSFLAERAAWRAVIHLNLVRSVTAILDVLASELAITSPRPNSPGSDPLSLLLPYQGQDADDDLDADPESDGSPEADSTPPPILTDEHRLLLLRLTPLRRIQHDLERRLGAASSEVPEPTIGGAAPWARGREFAVTSRSGWRSALTRVRAVGRASLDSKEARDEARVETESVSGAMEMGWTPGKAAGKQRATQRGRSDEPGDVGSAAEVIASCAEDVGALWADPGVKALLVRRGMRLEEGAGFFLNDVARIAARGYQPSDQDVRGAEAGREWLIYDVGGARSLRHKWYPYFDDINAIIFLAPISCFDERLAEDRRVNRLQDSLLLWKAVCSTKLLCGVQMILFLNKCDLLQRKLARGVARYFRQQFKDTLMKHSPEPRGFYSYLTSVVDTKATAITVATVREGIQRNNLKDADIL
ncbi:Guanine nucleotide-binding protein G(t) subunit alpha-3 [Grifola frondosa]|uniref:Guanine nucleotide-binding protein G(T) subunit alpha-3 n=1 Tax=Grifola frondosa TaxID=5627 RepID=A0A1C7LPK5_GRIFR|nr:Guanine nucleotide-binding protein G(t) subunit alpha-3 [Grifola frondosa]